MLAYNGSWIESLEISRAAKRWLESGLISREQYSTVRSAHASPLYTPNIFVRAGLAIFTAICVSGFVGLFGMLFASGSDSALSVWFMITGLCCIVALEALIRAKNLYCAGIDDALLYAGVALFLTGVLFTLFKSIFDLSLLVPALIALPILVAATNRYADRLTALSAFACILWIIIHPLMEGGPAAQAILPFIIMAVSLVFYFGAIALGRREKLRHWSKPLAIIEIASLAVFYLSGNYLIVRESTVQFLGVEISDGGNIPLAFLFYALTIAIPIAYVWIGLRRRDSNLLRVGLLAAAFSAWTFRYYFSLGHPEVILTVAGIMLIVVAILAIRSLRKARTGLTHERLLVRKLENLDAEMLVVSQTLGTTPQQQPEAQFKPGGGTSGGGGTTESW